MPAIAGSTLVTSAGPDVLLLDLGRSPVRGLEIVQPVKAAPRAPAVVAMTLFHTPEAAAAASKAGADALVGKESFVKGLSQALARLFPVAISLAVSGEHRHFLLGLTVAFLLAAAMPCS